MPKNICAAVKEGDLETVKKLLKAGADIEIRCTKEGDISDLKENQKTLLHLAIENSDQEMIAFIVNYYSHKLDSKELLLALDENGYNVLRLAIEKQRKSVHVITEEIHKSTKKEISKVYSGTPGQKNINNLKSSLELCMSGGLYLAIDKKDYKLFDYFFEKIENSNLPVSPPNLLFHFNVINFNSVDKDNIEEYFRDGLMQLGAYDPDPGSRKFRKAVNEGKLELAEKIKKQKEEADRIAIKRDKRIKNATNNNNETLHDKLICLSIIGFFSFIFIVIILL